MGCYGDLFQSLSREMGIALRWEGRVGREVVEVGEYGVSVNVDQKSQSMF